MKKKTCIGRVAIVHPQITIDPLNRRGESGTVVNIMDADVIELKFNDGSTGLYQSDTVLMLQSHKAIVEGYNRDCHNLNKIEGIVSLYVIRKAFEKNYAEALILAMKYDRIGAFATISCQDYLELKRQAVVNRISKSKKL